MGSASMHAAQSANDESPIKLPEFHVTDNRILPEPEAWQYGALESFEILSNAPEGAVQRLLRDFEVFRQALSYLWPVPKTLTPIPLVLVGRGGKFDAFVPEGAVDPDVANASLFLRRGRRSAIVVDLQSKTLEILGSGAYSPPQTDGSLISVEHDKQLYREYVRYLLSASEPRLPAWFEEGMAQIAMRMQIVNNREVVFARLEDPNATSVQAGMRAALVALDPELGGMFADAPAEDRDFNVALRGQSLVDFATFFAITHDSSVARNPLGNNVWAKQAYAFVHLCLYGERGKFTKPFMTFLQRSSREPVTEAMFKDCFGMTYKQLEMLLRTYCNFTVYEAKGVRAKKGSADLIVVPPPVALRSASQSEIGRIKGDVLVLAGKPEAAREELIAPYIRGERDAALMAALGVFEKERGEEERARRLLEAAFSARMEDQEALIALARLRYDEAINKPGAEQGRLSAPQVRAVTEPLLQARRLPPENPAIYELLADAWTRSAVKPTREEAIPVISGAVAFPSRLKLVYACIFLAEEIGDLKSAHVLADHGIQHARDEVLRERFRKVKADLPPVQPQVNTEARR